MSGADRDPRQVSASGEGARLLVVTTADAAPGFRLAGVATQPVQDAQAAAEMVRDALATGAERGIIAVHEPFLRRFDQAFRDSLEDRTVPLVVALPAAAGEDRRDRRARLLRMLARAVGFELTFDTGEPR